MNNYSPSTVYSVMRTDVWKNAVSCTDNDNELYISSSNVFMGATGSAYMSASNGQMEISSSNFFLAAAGDVTMTGTISSSEGNIAGWTIDTDEINSFNIYNLYNKYNL